MNMPHFTNLTRFFKGHNAGTATVEYHSLPLGIVAQCNYGQCYNSLEVLLIWRSSVPRPARHTCTAREQTHTVHPASWVRH